MEVDRATARAFTPKLATKLRRSRLNAVVLGETLTAAQRARVVTLARSRGFLLFDPLREAAPGTWATVLEATERCRALKTEDPEQRCAVLASSVTSARRLAADPSVDVAIVKVRTPGHARRLANASDRVVPISGLGPRGRLKPWRALARLAHRSKSLDFAAGVKGDTRTSMSRLADVVSTTTKGDRKAPTAPTGLSATGESVLTLSWNASKDNRGVTGYTVYRDGARVGTTGGTSYVLDGLACGQAYTLAVDAFDAAGNHSAKTVLQATPVCSALVYTMTPADGATVSGSVRWEAGVGDVAVSKIEFLVDGSLRWTERNAPYVFAGNDATWDTTTVTNGAHELTLRLTTADATVVTSTITVHVSNGTSSPSPPPSPPPAPPPPPPPPPGDTSPPTTPTGLVKTGGTTSSIAIAWSASSDDVGVAGYRIFQGATLVGTTSGTTYLLSGLACGTGYALAVAAYDAAGNESAKATLSASTGDCPPGGEAADVFLSPTGSDSNACTAAAPCKSLSRAYQVASLGDVVELAGGTYGDQFLEAKHAKSPSVPLADRIVFRPAAGAAVETGRVEINVPHVEFRDMKLAKFKARYYQANPGQYAAGNLFFRNIRTHHFSLNAVHHVSFIGGEVGPNRNPVTGDWPQDGVFVGTYPADVHPASHLLFDGVYVHDVTEPTSTAHSDCIQFTAGIDVTIRNSRFRNCEHADLMIKGDQGPIDGFLIENNFFDRTLSAYYSINMNETSRGCQNVLIRNNTALQNIRLEACTGATFMGNIQPSMSSNTCSHAVAQVNWNVYESGQKCGANDVVGAISYVSRSSFDLRLTAGSVAIDRGNPSSYPARDIDGQARPKGGAPDAGAHEHS